MEAQISDPGVYPTSVLRGEDAHSSGVSWGAVFAGAAAAAALSLILLILGFGLGLSAISPWSYNVAAIGTSTIAWIAFMQLAASGVGGYLAGRLRIKWPSVHTDEVYFRDTAHGLLAWSVGSLVTAALLAGVVRILLGGALDVSAGAAAVVAPVVAGAANSASSSGGNPVDYFSDMLLRTDQAGSDTTNVATRNEVTKIMVTNMHDGKLASADRDYLARIIEKRTNLSQADAEQRVDAIYSRVSKTVSDAQAAAKQTAETARKAAAHSALWMFVALLFGAFVSSLAATIGGRQRDNAQLYVRN